MKCEHPDDKVHSKWKYIGDKLDTASGYCTACGQQFILDERVGRLIPGNQEITYLEKRLAKLKGKNK